MKPSDPRFLQAGRKRPVDAGEGHGSHRLGSIVASSQVARERRWWAFLTESELEEVLADEDPCVVSSALPGEDAERCSELLGRHVSSDVSLRRALRADYQRARQEHRAATSKALKAAP